MSAPLPIPDNAELLKRFFQRRIPYTETVRFDPGRNISLGHIANAIRSAEIGWMSPLTDLSGKTIDLDPHLANCLLKRFGQLAACDWDLTPSQVEGIDKTKAKFVADIVRGQLMQARSGDEGDAGFRQVIDDLCWGFWDGRAAQEIHWAENRPTPEMPVTKRLVGFQWVHPRRLSFDEERSLRFAEPIHNTGFYEVGLKLADYPGKFIKFLPRMFREYPEREGLAPRAMYWAYFKRTSARWRMALCELFGLPWKIIESELDSPADTPALDKVMDDVESLGVKNTTLRLPKGVKLSVPWPQPKSGEIFSLTIGDCNAEISKLINGQVGTSDAQPQGLGSGQADMHKGEQDLIKMRDGWMLSEAIQRQVVEVIVLANFAGLFGAAIWAYMPKFELRTAPQKDRAVELARLEKTAALVPVAVDEIYETSGARKPGDDEATVQMVDASPLGGAPRLRVVPSVTEQKKRADAEHAASAAAASTTSAFAGAFELTPTDVATIITVNQGLASIGLPPMTRPDGSPDPDGFLTIAAYKAKNAATIAEAAAADQGNAAPATAGAAGALAPPGPGGTAPRSDEHDAEEETEPGAEEAAVKAAERYAAWCLTVPPPRVCAVVFGVPQPATRNGSPELLINKGVAEAARETERWSARFTEAVTGLEKETAIYRALAEAVGDIDVGKFARQFERRVVHGLMLGGLDAELDATRDEPLSPIAFDERPAGLVLLDAFVRRPFNEAIGEFLGRKIVPKSLFTQLQAAARRRAFTVAGLAKKEMLRIAHDELTKAITEGAKLSDFAEQLARRFESAGWTTLSKSHVEVVFRNGVMGAYSDGRRVQMSQPAVLKARPFWQILGVRDDRARATHAAARNLVVRADDPFWQKSPTPWGHNCRCRVVSRSQKDVERLGLKVVSGSAIADLPDEGWDNSGSLLAA